MLRSAPPLWAVLATVVAVALGLLTNLVTGGSPSWWVLACFVVVAVASVVLAWWFAVVKVREGRAQLRTRRNEVLRPFSDSGSGGHTVVSLLDPLAGLSPFVGRSSEVDELLMWCTAPGGDRVRVLDGPSGVGKTRLAREVARSLSAGWASGLALSGRLGDVVAAVVACGDAALVVVDDADTVSDVVKLVDAVQRHEGAPMVRLLLVVRDAAAFARWLAAARGPAGVVRDWEVTPVGVAGGDGDRRRWFGEALRAYREALVPDQRFIPPHVGAVGAPGEMMMVTCVRAALAAVAGGSPAEVERVRLVDSDEIAAHLLVHERRRWADVAADPRWQLNGTGVTDTRLAEAMLTLVLAGPTTIDRALAVLRRLTSLGGQPASVYHAILEWAQHVYPGSDAPGKPLLEPRPDYLAAALIVSCAGSEHAQIVEAVLGADHGDASAISSEALVGLVRAAGWFPRAAVLLGSVLEHDPALVVPAIQAAALAGSPARIAVRVQLLAALALANLTEDSLRDRSEIT